MSEWNLKPVEVNDILFLQANRAYCKITTKDKVFKLSSSLREVMDQFKGYSQIVRVHRETAVNLTHVTAFNSGFIRIGKDVFGVSRTFQKDVFGKLKDTARIIS